MFSSSKADCKQKAARLQQKANSRKAPKGSLSLLPEEYENILLFQPVGRGAQARRVSVNWVPDSAVQFSRLGPESLQFTRELVFFRFE